MNDEVYRTQTGCELTDADIRNLSDEAERGYAIEHLLDVPVVFGLRAQGKLEAVTQMVADGKTWDEIGETIGWASAEAERFWEMEKER